MTKQRRKKSDLEPLKISCTSSNCDEDLHCFKATRRMKLDDEIGMCRSCGVDLVEWDRLNERNLNDVAYTFEALRRELIRHFFWHVDIDQKAINYARRKGKKGMKEAVRKRIESSVGPEQPYRDGTQTKMQDCGNPIHYAQHATASCCRTCIEYWHGIPKGRELSGEEVEYLSQLVILYVNERLPFLSENGEKVAPIRKPKQKELSAK